MLARQRLRPLCTPSEEPVFSSLNRTALFYLESQIHYQDNNSGFSLNMREEEIETAIKVVVVGNGAVGKSSMIQRYCKGIFTSEYKKTIGVDFLERPIE